jgi:hypothetical protein
MDASTRAPAKRPAVARVGPAGAVASWRVGRRREIAFCFVRGGIKMERRFSSDDPGRRGRLGFDFGQRASIIISMREREKGARTNKRDDATLERKVGTVRTIEEMPFVA